MSPIPKLWEQRLVERAERQSGKIADDDPLPVPYEDVTVTDIDVMTVNGGLRFTFRKDTDRLDESDATYITVTIDNEIHRVARAQICWISIVERVEKRKLARFTPEAATS